MVTLMDREGLGDHFGMKHMFLFVGEHIERHLESKHNVLIMRKNSSLCHFW